MGDRSSILIREGEATPLYLYGHWMGEGVFGPVSVGLKSGRVGDVPYLTRIIFCSMVAHDVTGETGYGISTYLCDNEYPILTVDGNTGETWLESEEGTRTTGKVARLDFLEATLETFEDFAALAGPA